MGSERLFIEKQMSLFVFLTVILCIMVKFFPVPHSFQFIQSKYKKKLKDLSMLQIRAV